MQTNVDLALFYEIWQEIDKLARYFYKFAKDDANEAMQQTLLHALKHYDAEKGNLNAYIKKLARDILKVPDRIVFVDFLEDTLGDGDDFLEINNKQNNNVQHASTQVDFSEEIISRIDEELSLHKEIIEYTLSSLDRFIVLCEAIIRRDTATTYYPEYFVKDTLKLSKKYKSFNEQILDLYYEYGDEIKWFLALDRHNRGIWKEADFILIRNRKAKKIKFIDKETGLEIEDPDVDKYILSGELNTSLKQRRIVKVPYLDLWEKLCDKIDDIDSNELN